MCPCASARETRSTTTVVHEVRRSELMSLRTARALRCVMISVTDHVALVGLRRVPSKIRQPVVARISVSVAALVFRTRTRTSERLQHENVHTDNAPLTFPLEFVPAVARLRFDLAGEHSGWHREVTRASPSDTGKRPYSTKITDFVRGLETRHGQPTLYTQLTPLGRPSPRTASTVAGVLLGLDPSGTI